MIANLNQRFAAITKREKVITLIAGIVVIVFVGYFHFIEPNWQNKIEIDKSSASISTELASIQAQQQVFLAHLQQDFDQPLLASLASQQAMLQQLDVKMDAFLESMVEPTQMAYVIQSLLSKLDSVKVVALKSLSPRALSNNPDDVLRLYEHGLDVTLEGSYSALHAFLDSAESLPWKFNWQDYRLSVSEYPNSTLHVQLRTYSLHKEFIKL